MIVHDTIMQARAGIREVHFFPFNPVDKRTALTYIDSNDNWHRVSKGAPEQVKLSVFVFLIGTNFFFFSKNNDMYFYHLSLFETDFKPLQFQ